MEDRPQHGRLELMLRGFAWVGVIGGGVFLLMWGSPRIRYVGFRYLEEGATVVAVAAGIVGCIYFLRGHAFDAESRWLIPSAAVGS